MASTHTIDSPREGFGAYVHTPLIYVPPAPPRARRRRSSAFVEEAESRPSRVLVAEDDDAMRALLVDTLRDAGYQVIEAANGRQLERCLRNRRLAPKPDLVVSDVRMPGQSGLEVLEHLRDRDWLMPVILITAFADEPTRTRARELGAATVMSKPFDLEAMLHAVRAIVPPFVDPV